MESKRCGRKSEFRYWCSTADQQLDGENLCMTLSSAVAETRLAMLSWLEPVQYTDDPYTNRVLLWLPLSKDDDLSRYKSHK